MTDYDLPAEYRVALRRAKKKTTLGSAIGLLGVFWPISVEIGLLKSLKFDGAPPHPLLDPSSEQLGKILVAAGFVGMAIGIGIVAFGWIEEGRIQRQIESWREAPSAGRK